MTAIKSTIRSARRTVVAAWLVGLAGVVSCSDSGPTGPGAAQGDLLLVTSIPDQTGVNGSSFIQTAGLDRDQIGNADAHEQTFYPYASIHGNTVIVTQHSYGDQAIRYQRGADGRLVETGRLSLPPGGFGAGVAFASATKAYVAMTFAGRILIINPQTMTQTGEIDLTTLGIARNPANPNDRNPEPAALIVHNGKLHVGLQQLVTAYSSADGTDIAIIDVATDQFEQVVHDPRSAGPGRYGDNATMFVDELGDLYVYCVASFGFVPGQKAGLLRIRSGETGFDPDYFINLTDASVDVPGGRIGLLNGFAYGGDGFVYGIAELPTLASNPPQYATDRNFQPVRVRLDTGAVEALPIPRSNGIARGLTIHEGRVLFGLATATGVGVYSYDPVTRQASAAPVLRTSGDPTIVMSFD
jgi:hypothetical protein